MGFQDSIREVAEAGLVSVGFAVSWRSRVVWSLAYLVVRRLFELIVVCCRSSGSKSKARSYPSVIGFAAFTGVSSSGDASFLSPRVTMAAAPERSRPDFEGQRSVGRSEPDVFFGSRAGQGSGRRQRCAS